MITSRNVTDADPELEPARSMAADAALEAARLRGVLRTMGYFRTDICFTSLRLSGEEFVLLSDLVVATGLETEQAIALAAREFLERHAALAKLDEMEGSR